ncbi:hypothetical protein [Streptomyces sp. 8N706]|uniref:hypothetical protein n=1 Tax=Streptomyces sp. 8N706 TaxID=3457416 RepID=UPI003FD20DE1
MQRLLLALAYYLVVTPAGLLSRLVRDPLRRRPDGKATTYWVFTGAPDTAAGAAAGPAAPPVTTG